MPAKTAQDEYSDFMAKSPLILAALANDAAPKLKFSSVKPIGTAEGLFDTALLTSDEDGTHYTIKMPRSKVAGLALDTELSVIRAFNDQIRARLPFDVTKLIGSTFDADGVRAMVFSFVYGNQIDLTILPADHPLNESLGKSLAAIHNLPLELVENAGLPSFNPQASIRLRVAELDKARETGRIPSILNDRWEKAFEDVSIFKYQPTVIHSELNGQNVLELDGEVAGVLDWTGLRIGDPAEDFGWIFGSQNFEAAYSILLAYQQARPGADPNIKQRATLYSELEIVRWLMYNIKHNEEIAVNQALEMLADLAAEVEAGHAPALTSTPIGSPAATEIQAGYSIDVDSSSIEVPGFAVDAPLPMPTISEGAFAIEEAEEAVSTATRPIDVVHESDSGEALVDDLADSQIVNDSPIDEILSAEVAVEAETGDYDERKDETKPAKDDELF